MLRVSLGVIAVAKEFPRNTSSAFVVSFDESIDKSLISTEGNAGNGAFDRAPHHDPSFRNHSFFNEDHSGLK
jgi:hypothetical protein